MAWLTALTQHSCTQLNDACMTLSSLKDNCLLASDDYYQVGVRLVEEKQYSGKGARAFLAELGTDTNTHRIVLDGIGHVASAAQICGETISSSSSTYDNRLLSIQPLPGGQEAQAFYSSSEFDAWRDYLIDNTLANVNAGAPAIGQQDPLSCILVSGSGAIIESFDTAKQVASDAVGQYVDNTIASAESLSNDPVGYQHSAGYYFQYKGGAAPFRTYCFAAFSDLAEQVWTNLSAWAEEVTGAALTFFRTLQDSESYLSARDVYDFIYTQVDSTQSTNKPISITPYKNSAGQTCLLITVGGLDNKHTWDDDMETAIDTGMNYPAPYLRDVEAAITQYMHEHRDMRGAQVTFAGYSLGGMTVQNLVDYSPEFLQQYNLQATNVVTYGSPVMGPPQGNVSYTMYDATADPVPLLSYYENPELGSGPGGQQPNFPAAGGMIVGAETTSWDNKLKNYIDSEGQYKGNIIGITDKGTDPAKLFDNHMKYYQSNQLNGPDTSIDIDPNSLGPTEYFPMKNGS